MANETTKALIDSFIDPIREAALWYAGHNFVMPRLITAFNDRIGFAPRTTSSYQEGDAPAELAELDNLTPEAFERAALETLTPKEYGKQHVITDRRIETDVENVMVDAAKDIGYTVGKGLEVNLLNLFSQFTGGVYGSASSRMSFDKLQSARARLMKSGVPGPYYAVLDIYQYLDIWNDFTDLAKPAPLSVRDAMMQNFVLTEVGGIPIFVSMLVPRTAVTDEVQTVTVSGSPTGGTFKLSFGEQETATIAYNAAAATVQTALRALANIGSTGVTVTGSAGGPYTVTFVGTLAGENVPLILLAPGSNALTGGTSPSVAAVETTAGANYALGGVFSRDALAVDLRRPMRIEPERDASQRWTELNATIVYASGKWRPERGVILKSDASTPLQPE